MTHIDENRLRAALAQATNDEKAEIQALLDELTRRETQARCQQDFLAFVKHIWPSFIEGEHHKRIASLFNEIAFGNKKRLIISLAPRHTKSEFASFLLPAWYLGLFPSDKIIQVSNTAELAEGFGSRVRNLLDTSDYTSIFPDITLRSDSKARGRWDTNKGGTYFAAGVGAALAGRGADLAILDDLHTEAEALAAVHNPGIYDKVYDWYTTGIRQRLQPNGKIVVVMTRWSKRDIIGQILENMGKPGADKWDYIEFPAMLPSDTPLWPEYWPYEELNAIRAELPAHKWMAQYQQQPSSDETAIVKRDWWQRWAKEEPPPCDYTIMSLDCAFEAKESADFSAMTYWGVFTNAETNEQNIILLDAERKKLEFPELKQWAFDLYKEHKPDTIIVEKKASGAPLIFEFRRMGVPVQEYTPTRKANGVSNDKIARLNAVADIFSSGMVWAPYKRWAEDVIEELANFPAGRYDDYVDTTTQALSRIRKGNMVSTRLDQQETWEDRMLFKARKARYY